jgi:hypothetical protein
MPMTLSRSAGSTHSQISTVEPFAPPSSRPVSAQLLFRNQYHTPSPHKLAPPRDGITKRGKPTKIMPPLFAKVHTLNVTQDIVADPGQCRLVIREGQSGGTRRMAATAQSRSPECQPGPNSLARECYQSPINECYFCPQLSQVNCSSQDRDQTVPSDRSSGSRRFIRNRLCRRLSSLAS